MAWVWLVLCPAAAASEPELLPSATRHLGTHSCTAVACHGSPEPVPGEERAVSQAFHLWLRGDPHAQAGRRMAEPRFQEVLQRASRRADGSRDGRVAARCARCHAPERLDAASDDAAFSQASPSGGVPLSAGGIGCETCHGPASGWLTRHYELGHEREELVALGMVDTKNVLVRARLCAECHVGSSANDMDHDMLAAGHPPLRFELSAHQALLTRKHWDDRPRRLVEPEYEVQLWAAGQLAAAEAALALLEGRALAAGGDGQPARRPWPELAEANCVACHQPLRAGAEPLPLESSPARPAGVPAWQSWNTCYAGLLAGAAPQDRAQLPAPNETAAALAALRQTMERSLVPAAEAAARHARAAHRALESAVRLDGANKLLGKEGTPLDAAGLLTLLGADRAPPTWDRLCQKLGALVAAERSLRDAALARSAAPGSGAGPYVAGRQELRPPGGIEPIAAALRFRHPDREWPAVLAGLSAADPERADTMSLGEAAAALEAWRASLLQASTRWDAAAAAGRPESPRRTAATGARDSRGK